MKKIKMSTQLILGYVMVTTLTLIVGVISLYNTNQLSQQASAIYLKNLEPILVLEDKLKQLQSFRLKVFSLLSEEDMEIVEKSVERLIAQMPEIDQILLNQDGLALSEKQREQWKQATAEWNQVKEGYSQIFAMTQNYAIELALELLAGKNTKQYNTLEKVFDELIRQKQLESQQSYQSTNQIKDFTLWSTLASLGGSVLLALMIGFILIRGILRKVGGDPSEIDQLAQQVARGNFDIGESKQKPLTGIHKSLREMVDSLSSVMAQVTASSKKVSGGAGEIASSSQLLAMGTSTQASSLEQISSSITEINEQLSQNVQNASQANQLASSVRESAQVGNQKMKEMLTAMAEISQSSQNVSKIIKVIDEIAFQTNLLALNAAVEAARAGVHGKGFAVVANEVRNLAVRSADAARETSEMIEGAVHKIEEGMEVANMTAQAFEEIVEGIGKVSDLMGEIDAASQEQASGIGQINHGITQLDQVTQQNASSSEQTAASAEELSQQSLLLQKLIGQFLLKGMVKNSDPLPELPKTEPPPAVPAKALPAAPPKELAPAQIIPLDDEEFGKF